MYRILREAGEDTTMEQARELYAKASGAIPLSDEELETVAGGCGDDDNAIVSCEQCNAAVRKSEAVVEGCEYYSAGAYTSRVFYFCCDACCETFKGIHTTYGW